MNGFVDHLLAFIAFLVVTMFVLVMLSIGVYALDHIWTEILK